MLAASVISAVLPATPTIDWLVLAATVTALLAHAAAVTLQIAMISPSISCVVDGKVMVITEPLVTLNSNAPPVAILAVETVVPVGGVFAPIVNDAVGNAVKYA